MITNGATCTCTMYTGTWSHRNVHIYMYNAVKLHVPGNFRALFSGELLYMFPHPGFCTHNFAALLGMAWLTAFDDQIAISQSVEQTILTIDVLHLHVWFKTTRTIS